MQVDKNTILTAIYIIVDDIIKSSPIIQTALSRPGPNPELTDSEIVTIALYQELIGDPREDHFYRLHQSWLRKYFPNLNERSRYNRRKRDLWSIILAIRVTLLFLLHVFETDTALTDSAPVPAVSYKRDKRATKFHQAGYGFCNSKAMRYFGYKLHSLVTLTGTILDFVLTSAGPYDNQVVVEFFGRHQEQIRLVLGDKAYNDPELQAYLKEQFAIMLWAPRKANQIQVESKKSVKSKNTIRLIVETVNSQLQEQFHLSKHYAKSQWGIFTRIAAKITGHTIGMLINQILGRPKLALASLAV